MQLLSIDKMTTNQDKKLLSEWICLLFVRGFSLPSVFCWWLGSKCSSSPLIRWLWVRTWNFCWNRFVSYSFEFVHCRLSSLDWLVSKCISNMMTTNQDKELLLQWFVSYLFEVVHCLLFFSVWVLLESIGIIAMDHNKALLPKGMLLLCIWFSIAIRLLLIL